MLDFTPSAPGVKKAKESNNVFRKEGDIIKTIQNPNEILHNWTNTFSNIKKVMMTQGLNRNVSYIEITYINTKKAWVKCFKFNR